jgi:HSP20 family protein
MNTFSKTESQAPSTVSTGRTNFVTPFANIAETKDGYVLEAEMPGVSRDGLEVTVENGDLTIIGRRKNYESPGVLLYGESRGADFRRTFEIDPSINTAGITAKIEQGVLTLHLPKAEAVKPRKISVTD